MTNNIYLFWFFFLVIIVGLYIWDHVQEKKAKDAFLIKQPNKKVYQSLGKTKPLPKFKQISTPDLPKLDFQDTLPDLDKGLLVTELSPDDWKECAKECVEIKEK